MAFEGTAKRKREIRSTVCPPLMASAYFAVRYSLGSVGLSKVPISSATLQIFFAYFG